MYEPLKATQDQNSCLFSLVTTMASTSHDLPFERKRVVTARIVGWVDDRPLFTAPTTFLTCTTPLRLTWPHTYFLLPIAMSESGHKTNTYHVFFSFQCHHSPEQLSSEVKRQTCPKDRSQYGEDRPREYDF